MIFRPPTWEADLAAALERARGETFAWWRADCVTVACRLVYAATGRDPLRIVRRPWTQATAAVILATFGGLDGVLALFAESCGLQPTPPPHAPRGALLCLMNDAGEMSAACHVGTGYAAMTEARGFMLLRPDPATVHAAWSDLYDRPLQRLADRQA